MEQKNDVKKVLSKEEMVHLRWITRSQIAKNAEIAQKIESNNRKLAVIGSISLGIPILIMIYVSWFR